VISSFLVFVSIRFCCFQWGNKLLVLSPTTRLKLSLPFCPHDLPHDLYHFVSAIPLSTFVVCLFLWLGFLSAQSAFFLNPGALKENNVSFWEILATSLECSLTWGYSSINIAKQWARLLFLFSNCILMIPFTFAVCSVIFQPIQVLNLCERSVSE
jgi:hypothetical protein